MLLNSNECTQTHFDFQRYEEWKDGLPDFKWLNDVLPDNEQWNKFSNDLKTIQNSIRDTIEIGELDQSIQFILVLTEC